MRGRSTLPPSSERHTPHLLGLVELLTQHLVLPNHCADQFHLLHLIEFCLCVCFYFTTSLQQTMSGMACWWHFHRFAVSFHLQLWISSNNLLVFDNTSNLDSTVVLAADSVVVGPVTISMILLLSSKRWLMSCLNLFWVSYSFRPQNRPGMFVNKPFWQS